MTIEQRCNHCGECSIYYSVKDDKDKEVARFWEKKLAVEYVRENFKFKLFALMIESALRK